LKGWLAQSHGSAATLLLGLALLRVRPSALRPGLLALAAFLACAALAFGLQFLRTDSALRIGPLNETQLIYLAWLAAGAAVAIFFAQRASPPAVA
jgi:hypothetical protein